MKHPLANRTGLAFMLALLMGSGALCPKCGFGTKATSKRWARCKKCGTRVSRRDIDEVGDTIKRRLTPQDWRCDAEIEAV